MATLEFAEKLKPCIQHLEGFISSAESREDLASLLNKSVEILRTLYCLLSSLPSLNVSDDVLHQKARYIFENGILVIDSIAQFQANDMDPALEKLCNLRHVLEESLPELKAVGLHSYTRNSDGKLDLSCEDHPARCLRIITNAMGNILEMLKCFQGAFFMCREASVCVKEFSIVWPQLKDIITQLESTTIGTHGQTSANSFMSTFSSTLDRLLKISMNALWLLFSFPETEHKEFEVIISLCHSAVQIFVNATDILNCLAQFFLKDSLKLKAPLDGLSQSMQAVHTHCREMFELKCDSVAIFENVCDQKCSSGDILKNATVNTESVPQNFQGKERERVASSHKTFEETFVQDSTESMNDASASPNLCSLQSMGMENAMREQNMSSRESTVDMGDRVISQSSCKSEGSNMDDVPVPLSTNLYEGTSALLEGVSARTAASSVSSSDAKLDVKTAIVSKINPVSDHLSSSLLQDLCDVKFDSLMLSQRKILKKIMGKYKCHIDHFSSCKITKFEFVVMCKLCGENLSVRNIEEHINHPHHQQNLYSKYKDSQEACTVISVVLNINPAPDSSHWSTLFIDFHDIKFDLLNLSQRKALEKVIKKIRHDTKHVSFIIKSTNSEILVLCKVCGKSLLMQSTKDYKSSTNFQHNHHKTCESSVAACIAMPDISIDKWQFLNFSPDTRHQCSLCAVTLGSSTDPFVENIHSVIHRSKLKLKNLNSAEGNVLNLVGFAHFFYNLLNTNFASLKVSLIQHEVKSGAKIKIAVNSFSIEKKRDSAELQFSCHACDWSMVWKNTVDHDIMSHNDWLGVTTHEEVWNNGLIKQSDDPWRNYFGTVQVLQKNLYVSWCKELVQNLNAKLSIIQNHTFSSVFENGYPNSPDYCDNYLQFPDRFMF